MKRRTASIAVAVSAACFATLGLLTKWAFANGAEPMSLLAVRFAAAAVVLGAAQLVRDPRALVVGRGDLLRFAMLSVTGYGAASLCYSYAVREVGASITTVLLFTYPALVAVIGWVFLRDRLSGRRVAAIVLTFAGCVLVADIFSSGGSLSVRGLTLGLAAGLSYAVFSVLSYRTLARSPRLTILTYMFGFSAIGLGALSATTGSLGRVPQWAPAAWVATALMVLVPTFIAVTLYFGGIRAMGAPQAAVVSTLELPFTVIMAALVFPDERLRPIQLIGAAVVLAGVVLAEWGAREGEVDAPAV